LERHNRVGISTRQFFKFNLTHKSCKVLLNYVFFSFVFCSSFNCAKQYLCLVSSMKKTIIFILLTIVLGYSLFELYNFSILYNDQASMSEFLTGAANQKPSPAETTQLNDFKFELNAWRTFFVCYIVFYVFYSIRLFFKTRRTT
jgi:hypothetical protein